MIDLCRRIRPNSLDDLTAINALYRPGPLDSGMVDNFIEIKHGQRAQTYPFPELERRETEAAIIHIREYEPDVVFLYLGGADEAGHLNGWMSEAYLQAVRNESSCIKRILNHDHVRLCQVCKFWFNIQKWMYSTVSVVKDREA